MKENPEAEGGSQPGIIQILQEQIELPSTYINQFTLSKLEIGTDRLTVQVENEEGQMETVKTEDFKIKNPNYL